MIIRPVGALDEVYDTYAIEKASYLPEAAASLEAFMFRSRSFGEFFLVAEKDGDIVGVINGVRTDSTDLSDEEMKQAAAHAPEGRHFCILTVAVKSACRRQGIGAALVKELIKAADSMRLESILLMCEEHLIPFYRALGFHYHGPSASLHGGINWHEMGLILQAAEQTPFE